MVVMGMTQAVKSICNIVGHMQPDHIAEHFVAVLRRLVTRDWCVNATARSWLLRSFVSGARNIYLLAMLAGSLRGLRHATSSRSDTRGCRRRSSASCAKCSRSCAATTRRWSEKLRRLRSAGSLQWYGIVSHISLAVWR